MEQPAEFNNNNNNDNLWQAGAAVATSLSQFEGAMDKLVNRLELTGDQVQRLMEIKSRAENIVNQMAGFSQRAVADVKRNPKSYLALAGIVGFFLLSRTSMFTDRAELDQRH